MPVLTPMTIKVHELRHGDMTDTGAIVDRLDRKEKWGYVTFVEQDKPQRILLDLDITVKRPVLTDEERAARDRAHAIEFLRDLLKQYGEDPTRDLRRVMSKAREEGYELLPAHAVDTAIHANAQYEVARAVNFRLKKINDPDNDMWRDLDDDGRFLVAWAIWYLEPTGRSWNSFDRDPLNRSTSVMSNIYEDLERWAFFDTQKRMERYGARDLIEETARMVKERNEERRR